MADRIVDFDVANLGVFWTFEPLTNKARDHIDHIMPHWPANQGMQLDTSGNADLGIDLIRRLLFDGFVVDLDGCPCSLRPQ